MLLALILLLLPVVVECTLGPCGRPPIRVGLGVENIGGGGMGPISDTGMGGSGSSDSMM